MLDAFDAVEFDAHKLDLRLKVLLERDPLGGEHSVEIERSGRAPLGCSADP